MQLDSNSLIMQWNTDINGNPVSKHIAREVQQISPTHNLIQLTQIPDEFYPLRIVTEDNVELKEVKYRNDMTDSTFYVDYGMGLVYFNENLSGKLVVINYYGRGVMLISDSRIFHKNGDTIADTWDNILERSQDALDLIETAGGLANAIKVIDQKVEEGTQVADRLEDFITETQFYGYTITLSREAFVVKADDNGEVGKTETSSVYTDVVVYQGAKQIVPTLTISNEYGCTFKVAGQRVSLATIDVNLIKVNAVLNIDCGDGLVAKRVLEVTKVFDGVNQYQVSMTNPFYSFQANSEGYIEEDQSVECSFKVSKANIDYENYTVQVQNLPQGLNYQINKGGVVFTAIAGRLLPSSGSCSVVLTIDGQSFNKPFTWNKAKKGQDAKSLTLVGNQIIRYEQPDYSDIPLQTKTTVSAKVVGLSGTPTWSFYNGNEWVVLENETALDLTFAYNDAIIWADRKEVTIKCELEGFYDELTIVKLANGTNGNDAITVVLTNESHTVAIDDSGYVESSEIENTRTNVLAYKGANSVTPKVTKGKCVGCDVTITGTTAQLASLDNSFTSSTAELLVEVDGVIITKVWTISKSKQGLQGQSGQNGKSYILNVTGGSRSVVYSQINQDPRPSLSSTFNGALYEDGVEVLEGVSWYWLANGHFEGTSINSGFTPTIKKVFDESVINNSISVIATYKGQTLTQEIPLSVTKDAYGLDWVSEWDDTKVDVRGNLILTPKIFAGHYDQENDLITGVAIGQDVLNNGRTIGVVGYQNNIPSFLLDTDGSLQVGNPFGENSTGLYYSDGVFKLKVNELSIEGAKVPTENEIGNMVTTEVNSAKNELQESIDSITNQMTDLDSYVNNALKDGILDNVERNKLEAMYDTMALEVDSVNARFQSIINNPFLTNEAIITSLNEAMTNYANTFQVVTDSLNKILESETVSGADVSALNNYIADFKDSSATLNKIMLDSLNSINEVQAQQLVDKAKEEIQAEVSDVNDALTDLENTINTDFKAGLITSINAANLENQLQQLAKEKADLDSQYNVIYNNANLSTTIKSKLLQAKSNYDIAHDTLVAKINTAIADNLMTEQELQEINSLIETYTEKLGAYSGVAQEANADIALNSAQSVVEALDQEAIFNKLTNNGEVQGIYLQDGKVYINGEYVNTRNLRAVRNDGTETFKVDSEGNVSIKANSFHLVGTDTNLADKNYVDTAIGNANINLTQDKVFNALTNNGQTQGIYLENSKIYINGEYIKAKSISGDKISAGVITATNGKSTINLDNGAMNLGNTTDASYLQWTGSDLNIKAKNISIGSSSVATSSDVTSAVNTAVNNIQVGGTNLAYDTNKGATGWGWSIQTNNGKTITGETINGINCVKFTKDSTSGSGWSYVSYGRFKRDKITPSTTYVVSFEMKSNLSFNVASVNLMNGDSSNSLVKTITAIQNKVVANSTAWNKIIFKLTTTDTLSTSTAQVIYITGIPYSANATHYIRNLKLEVGNKATQWSPAPEDITTDINTAKNDAISSANNTLNTTIANYYTKTQTDSQIKIAKDAINLGVSETYETKTNVTSKVNSAISTASSDATSKANNALNSAKSYADTKKSEAITSANNTLNSTIANYYTKSQTDSQIKVAKDAIDLSVKNTYETKTNVQNKIDAIQVGGRNLLPRARTFENWQGVGQNGVKVVKDGFKTGMNSLKFAQGGEAIVDNELQKKALKNLANTHMIVTNPEDSAYSLYPNPPKGSTFNSVNRDGSLRKGEISSNGSCWAIISAYKYYTEVPTSSAIEQKLLQIMKDCADFMCDNLSVGRFNSMNFEFIDTSYKYSSETRAGWTVGTYKELYLSTMFLQVKSLTYAYEIHKNQRYLDTAYKVLDSLYNVQIYIKDKVAKGDLPTEADGAFYEYLACDNLSSSNRFSGSTRILPLGMGYYITQAVDTLIEIVGDNERITAKGDSYRPSTIKTEYAKFLSSMIKTGNLTAKPTNLPYGHYYKSEDGTFKLGNWNFIDNAFGDEWFVGDVVCYTIIGLASLGFETEARQYMNAYYSLKVPNSSGRFAGDIVFYDRIDFSTGTHLPDDDSVSITYTALYMETGVILKEMTHVENCANTLLKWQVSEPNNIKVDGAYMWDISKDTSSLELKSYGEIVNSEFFKYLSPQKIRNRATTASVSTALTSNIVGKEFALSGWLKASDWNALASGLNACLKIGGKTYASLKLSDVIKNNNWTRFELLGSVEKEDEILTFELINNTSTTVEVAVLKLEKGNKITDFTDAPEDVEDNIVTSKNDAISSANNTLATTIANYYTKSQTDSQIEVVKDSITQSVASTYETKSDVTSKINGVNSSISNLQSRMSSAESKITDTAITNVVKQNFYTKTETNDQITSKGYQTASQVQQTVNNLQLKFTQSGGYNLFSNSGFKKGTSYWSTHAHNSPTGGSIGITTSTGDWGFPDASVNCVHIRLSNQSGIEYGISQAVKTTIGKKYTISFYYAGHRLNSANLIVRNSNSSWLASKAITSFPSGGNGNANNWSKHTLTFTANATSHNINIVIVSAANDGYLWVAKPMVVEGELDLPYSPNPNEMYDGIIEMNRDGIKVSTSNGGWTDFTSAGMNVYNKSNTLSLGTRNGGLTYHNSKGYLGFTSESNISSYDVAGVTLSTANSGSYIALGTSTATDPFGGFTSTPALSIAKANLGDSTSFYRQGVNLHTSLNVNTKPINRVGTMYYGVNGTTRTYESTTGNLCLLGDNGVVLGYYQGNDVVTKFKIIEGSSASESYIDTYAHWRFHGWNLTDVANLSIKNNIKMETTATIQFNSTATYPSLIWEASNRLKLYGNDGIDFGYRNGSSNMPIFKLHEGDDTAYRIESFSHWNFNNWNLENVGILKPQRLQLPSTYGSNWIGLGTGDGNDYTTYNVKFRTHNGLAFTDNSDSATVIVQGRQGRIMGKNAYYVNCSRSLKSDIRSVISEDDVTTFVAKEGESLDTNISAETVCDFLDAIDVKTYVTDFKQEGATQECFDIEKGNSLTLGYIADDIAEHPMFKYVGEKTNDGLYAINSNSLTTTLIVGYQQEKRKREQLEQRLLELERLLKGDK